MWRRKREWVGKWCKQAALSVSARESRVLRPVGSERRREENRRQGMRIRSRTNKGRQTHCAKHCLRRLARKDDMEFSMLSGVFYCLRVDGEFVVCVKAKVDSEITVRNSSTC